MSAYRQIAMEHLSIEELESIISEIKKKGSPQELSEEQKQKNRYREMIWKLH